MKIYGERKDEKVLTDVRAIYVSPDAEHVHIKIDLHSRKEAIARLFGRKIPVEFEPGVAPWYTGFRKKKSEILMIHTGGVKPNMKASAAMKLR